MHRIERLQEKLSKICWVVLSWTPEPGLVISTRGWDYNFL